MQTAGHRRTCLNPLRFDCQTSEPGAQTYRARCPFHRRSLKEPLKLITVAMRTYLPQTRMVGTEETILVSKQALLACEMHFPASNAAVLLAGLVALTENVGSAGDRIAEGHCDPCWHWFSVRDVCKTSVFNQPLSAACLLHVVSRYDEKSTKPVTSNCSPGHGCHECDGWICRRKRW